MKGKKKKRESSSRRSCSQSDAGRGRRTPLQQHWGLNQFNIKRFNVKKNNSVCSLTKSGNCQERLQDGDFLSLCGNTGLWRPLEVTRSTSIPRLKRELEQNCVCPFIISLRPHIDSFKIPHDCFMVSTFNGLTVLETERLQTFQKLTVGGAVSSRLKDVVVNDEDGASRESTDPPPPKVYSQ